MSERILDIVGGKKLEAALRQIEKRARTAGLLKVGFLEGATYPNGQNVATVATIQEFGAPSKNIPSRPFFRNTIQNKSDEWGDNIAVIAKSVDFDVQKTLGLMGEIIKGQIQLSIRNFNDPPNSVRTIKRKGFNKPLIDKGVMLRSVDYEVEEGGE